MVLAAPDAREPGVRDRYFDGPTSGAMTHRPRTDHRTAFGLFEWRRGALGCRNPFAPQRLVSVEES
jgi:hypothetical protein